MHTAFVKISSWFSAPRHTGTFGPTRCLEVWSSTFATAYKTEVVDNFEHVRYLQRPSEAQPHLVDTFDCLRAHPTFLYTCSDADTYQRITRDTVNCWRLDGNCATLKKKRKRIGCELGPGGNLDRDFARRKTIPGVSEWCDGNYGVKRRC